MISTGNEIYIHQVIEAGLNHGIVTASKSLGFLSRTATLSGRIGGILPRMPTYVGDVYGMLRRLYHEVNGI